MSRVLVFFLLFFVGISISAAGESISRTKNVQTALRARWPGTPILLEAGELLSGEWKDFYWDFIDVWLQDDDSSCSTARSCVEKIVKYGQSLLSEKLGSIFEFSLMLRSASPRLVLYRQLAENSLSSLSSVKGSNGTLSVPEGSCCWVDTGSKLLFSELDFFLWVDSLSESSEVDILSKLELFDFDHLYPGSSIKSHTTILYGALGTKCFRDFHRFLTEVAKKGKIKYVVRPVLSFGCGGINNYCGSVGSLDALNFGGYGVELALKNMEYKAIDDSVVKKGVTLEDPHTEDLTQDVRGFIFSKLLDRKAELSSEIMSFRDHLLSSTVSDTLEVWELKDVGHQTVQRIVHASDPLQAMLEINQNFPSIVSLLSRTKLNDSIKDEIVANQQMVPNGRSLMAINGALLNIEDIDLYMLMDLVHEELSLADQFLMLKIPHSTVLKLLSTPPLSESHVIRVDFRSCPVHYLNNLEEDSMYKRWRSNMNELLMPVFPGQLRYIKKNIYHAVYVLDPGTHCGAKAIDVILSLYENNIPMRFGILLYSSKIIKIIEANGGELPVSSTDEVLNEKMDDISTLLIRLFMYIKESNGAQLAFQFLSNVNSLSNISEDLPDELIEVHHVEQAFVETMTSKTKSLPQDILLKLEKDSKFMVATEQSSLSVFKLGLSSLKCCLLMNGLVHEASEDASMSAMNDELPRLQEKLYYGQIHSHTDILEHFLSENSFKRYNPQIIVGGKDKKKFISLSTLVVGKESLLGDISYLYSPGTADELKPLTHLLVINATSMTGMRLLHEGIHYLMEGTKKGRVGVLFNLNNDVLSPAIFFARIFNITASSFSHKAKVLEFLDQLCSSYQTTFLSMSSLDEENFMLFTEKVFELADDYGLPSEYYKETLSKLSADIIKSHLDKVSHFLYGQLGLDCGANAVVTNGRIILPRDNIFSKEDFVLLEMIEYEHRIKNIMEIIDKVEWVGIDPDDLTSKYISDAVLLVSSSLSIRERSSERARFEILNSKYSAVVLNNENATIHIDAVIDPLSPSGQKISPLLHILWKRIRPSMRIVLNPMSSLVDLPLKNYYRYVTPTMDDFSTTDYSVNGPKALFLNMPLSKTLTMNLDVPESWLVDPVVAIHDLDNILLENLGDERTLKAVFELEALVLTGHCSEKDHDHPSGLQLILKTKNSPHLIDTLVMSNLGYWQMKVSPGVWYLQLAPGRSADLYELNEIDDEGIKHPLSKRIVINDLRGKPIQLEVSKRKGMEYEELLVASAHDNQQTDKNKDSPSSWNKNLFKWASDFIGGNVKSRRKETNTTVVNKVVREGKTINIFSIASGHLYERFLKIMMLSVLKNTQRPVKFWFIKNYLSPQFKDVIPHIAQEYGFEYELITYKWPTWLHKQKEKQRIIWAYKILFLDVIFPLSLEKVIFVDADQVVRTDMGELYDMDIKGRPLAYTPFCDNNKEMDGYRFWRQGFWRDHLRGRPYHISALYVVDLVKFRQTAAGDNLRVVYETLSKDPNSLSNLDQDLPNYSQHQVPIFSLPQEWLWCESWCGNATKSKAKTIDLCNNPMTKEPKLQGARRIISEWEDLDQEARHVTTKMSSEGQETQDAIKQPVTFQVEDRSFTKKNTVSTDVDVDHSEL